MASFGQDGVVDGRDRAVDGLPEVDGRDGVLDGPPAVDGRDVLSSCLRPA